MNDLKQKILNLPTDCIRIGYSYLEEGCLVAKSLCSVADLKALANAPDKQNAASVRELIEAVTYRVKRLRAMARVTGKFVNMSITTAQLNEHANGLEVAVAKFEV